jgi:hypothetical protein
MEKFLGIFPRICWNFSENRSEFFHEYVGNFFGISKVKHQFFLGKIPSYNVIMEILLGTNTECTRNFSHGIILTFFWIFS